ncbi:retrotransposon protein, putative, ty1-copia subclass [Tanacetum coccineum]
MDEQPERDGLMNLPNRHARIIVVTFSNPLFDSNDDFTFSDDESLSDEDVPEDNVKIYSNPLFKFDDEYISSDVNSLFDEVLENIESKDSYVSNLDESALLVTPLSDFNEDECFDPGGDIDEIELLLHRDPSTPKMSVASILEGFIDEPPLEENDDLFDLESKENKWKKILYDASIDDLMTEDKVFDPRIHEKTFSPTYVRLSFEDRHYLFLIYVIRIFLPYLTYSMDSSFPLSSGSEDTIFDPDISVFSCYSQEPAQASRSWNKRFDKEIKKVGFTQNPDEPCVYLKASGSNVALLVLYVDDILIMGNNITMLQDVKSWLCKCFYMKDLGEATYILRIKITRDGSKRLIALTQSAYFDKILKKFKMDNSKRGSVSMQEKHDYRKSQGAKTPSKVKRIQRVLYALAIRSIMYEVRCTRPDVAFAPGTELKVTCYADAGFQTDKDDTKSQSGYVFVLNGGAVDWKSAKQSTIAMSSTEAEYNVAAEASMEAVWMRKFIDGLGDVIPSNKKLMEMLCDNAPAIAIANDPKIMKGARRYQRKYHYIRKVIQAGEIVMKKVHTYDNLADPFTKPMPYNKHFEHAMGIGVCPASSLMVIDCLTYVMTYTRPGIDFAVGKLSSYSSVLEGYTDASWINNTEYNSSTSDWVFLLGGGAISWASKKQTCVTNSTMVEKHDP